MGPYAAMIQKSILTRLEYRGSFFISLLTMVLYYITQFSIVGFTVNAFNEINGWNIYELAFLYSFILMAQGMNTLLFGPLVRFDEVIRTGSWDYLLIRPVSPLGALLSMKFDPAAIAHLILGVLFFMYSASTLDIELTIGTTITVIGLWIGGTLILAGIRLTVASFAFWAVSTESLVHFFVYSAKEFIIYPINIYRFPIPFVLTFIFPLAFINYYPAHAFLDKTAAFSDYFKYLSLPVGIMVFSISFALFRLGMKRYHSTGT